MCFNIENQIFPNDISSWKESTAKQNKRSEKIKVCDKTLFIPLLFESILISYFPIQLHGLQNTPHYLYRIEAKSTSGVSVCNTFYQSMPKLNWNKKSLAIRCKQISIYLSCDAFILSLSICETCIMNLIDIALISVQFWVIVFSYTFYKRPSKEKVDEIEIYGRNSNSIQKFFNSVSFNMWRFS